MQLRGGLETSNCQSGLTDVEQRELAATLRSDDPAVGLRAVGALHRLAEQIEARSVRAARERGWSWEFDRPVAITEFGCCTYRGAAAAGGRGFAILDITAPGLNSTPPRLNGRYVRDEAEQARELTEMLSIFDAARVDATFVMTFAAPLNPTSDDPLYDLDMASYSLVKSFGGRLGPLGTAHPEAPWDRSRHGTTYPGLPWEPKQSFRAVADLYTAHAAPSP